MFANAFKRRCSGRAPQKVKKRKVLIGIGIVFIAVFYVVRIALPNWVLKRNLEWTKQPIRDFSFQTINGRLASSRDLKGRTVAIFFWATWCGPCKAELPQIAELQQRYKARGDIVVLALNAKTGGDTADRAQEFLSHRHLQIVSAIDAVDDLHPAGLGSAGRSLGLRVVPSFYILDRQGQLRVAEAGYVSSANLVTVVSRVIDQLSEE